MVQSQTSLPDQADAPLAFSIVMITYARDAIAAAAIEYVTVAANGRQDIEFILVDNNPDTIDRGTLLAPFARWKYVKLGFNKGVSARNDGALASNGTLILFIDDDTFLTPVGALELYEKDFAVTRTAIVTARKSRLQHGRDTARSVSTHGQVEG